MNDKELNDFVDLMFSFDSNELKNETEFLKKYKKLQSNWNSLREYSKENIKILENRLSTPFCNFEKITKEIMIHQNYLDRMNELEGKDKE